MPTADASCEAEVEAVDMHVEKELPFRGGPRWWGAKRRGRDEMAEGEREEAATRLVSKHCGRMIQCPPSEGSPWSKGDFGAGWGRNSPWKTPASAPWRWNPPSQRPGRSLWSLLPCKSSRQSSAFLAGSSPGLCDDDFTRLNKALSRESDDDDVSRVAWSVVFAGDRRGAREGTQSATESLEEGSYRKRHPPTTRSSRRGWISCLRREGGQRGVRRHRGTQSLPERPARRGPASYEPSAERGTIAATVLT